MSVSRHVGRHFEITAEGVRFLDLTRAASRPVAVARAVPHRARRTAARCRSRRSPASSRTSNGTRPDDFMATDGDRQLVRSMLYPRPGLYARLTEMHDCGLLDRVFPEFARIHGRVIRDFYHKYTVDEHTLLAIRGVESLWNPTSSEPAALQLDPPGAARAGAADAGAALPRRRQVARRRARRRRASSSRRACSIGSSCRPTRAGRSSS